MTLGRSGAEYIRDQVAVMLRWCRIYRKTEWDWVRLAAERYALRHAGP